MRTLFKFQFKVSALPRNEFISILPFFFISQVSKSLSDTQQARHVEECRLFNLTASFMATSGWPTDGPKSQPRLASFVQINSYTTADTPAPTYMLLICLENSANAKRHVDNKILYPKFSSTFVAAVLIHRRENGTLSCVPVST